jgi:hypothetical protein
MVCGDEIPFDFCLSFLCLLKLLLCLLKLLLCLLVLLLLSNPHLTDKRAQSGFDDRLMTRSQKAKTGSVRIDQMLKVES